MPSQPFIAITLGEPAGIGPEIALRAAWELRHNTHSILIGDWKLLEKLASDMDKNIRLQRLSKEAFAKVKSHHNADRLIIIDCPLSQPPQPGYPTSVNARAILDTLDLAMQGAKQKYFDAIVTAPIQKSVINEAGFPFTGHTEYLAEKMHAEQVVMLLAGWIAIPEKTSPQSLRVALATTHLPLRHVSAAISVDSLTRTIHILHTGLQEKFGITRPRILVSGLNPHAGENGYLGAEEIEIIRPVISAMQQKGIAVDGPFPADTLFLPRHLDMADCFLVMYHDQGLPVLKYATFGHGVNITLGLPVIRTSVDHGTALDLAMQGIGLADHGSMLAAIRMASDMASQQM